MKKYFGEVLVIFSSFFYASYGIFTKQLDDYVGGFAASFLRSVLVVIVLLPFWLLSKKYEPLNFSKNYVYIAGLIVFSFFIWGPLFYAVNKIGVGLSLSINYSAILIFVYLLGAIIFHENLSSVKIGALLFSILGIFLVYYSDYSNLDFLAIFFAILSGFGTAGNIAIVKKLPYNSLQNTLVLWSTSVIANLIMSMMFKQKLPSLSNHKVYWYLLGFAIVSILATYSLNIALKIVQVQIAGILGVLEIVFSVIFGVFLFHENIKPVAYVGIILIIIASILPFTVKDRTSS